jgi:regulator of cell morphogenesis and NO signaling
MVHPAERLLPTPSMKMAELIAISPSLPGVLTRMGIPFGFGDETVEEVCRRNGTDPETFLLICSVYSGDGSLPAKERIRKADLKDVLKYLRRSHAYYMEVAMQEITAALVALTEPCDERHRNILRKFFTEYKEELFKHLEYEENIVFPQAEAALRNGHPTPDDYEENHSHVEEKLEDLKNLVMKYMPPVCGQQDIYRALTCIFSLQEDLSRHILVEDGILVPIVNRRMHTDLESRFDTPGVKGEELSAREKEILVCVAKGMLNKEIADAENISIHTVITHRKNITRKTGIKTVAGLTVYALLNNLIDINTIE